MIAISATPLANLHLSSRTHNALRRNGIHTIEQLSKLDFDRLMLLKEIGRVLAQEIQDSLSSYQRVNQI